MSEVSSVIKIGSGGDPGNGRDMPTLKEAAAMQVQSVIDLQECSPVLSGLPAFKRSQKLGCLYLSIFLILTLNSNFLKDITEKGKYTMSVGHRIL